MTKYFKRAKPISYKAKVESTSLTIYMEELGELEVYEKKVEEEEEDLGDYNYNKYNKED